MKLEGKEKATENSGQRISTEDKAPTIEIKSNNPKTIIT
jgi:hypothetical protein